MLVRWHLAQRSDGVMPARRARRAPARPSRALGEEEIEEEGEHVDVGPGACPIKHMVWRGLAVGSAAGEDRGRLREGEVGEARDANDEEAEDDEEDMNRKKSAQLLAHARTRTHTLKEQAAELTGIGHRRHSQF